MRILIVGGAGFVGTQLRKRLNAKYDVAVFDRERTNPVNDDAKYIRGDISDYLSLASAFEAFKPDQVFHLAGMVSRKECEETPILAFQTNVLGSFNVCELCVRHNARVLYSGSSEEYGQGFSQGPITEESSFGPATGIYSLTKRFAEEVMQHFAYRKGLQATVMRYFMLYGPGEPFNEYRSAVTRFVNMALRNQPLPVHANTSRSWCYVWDAVDAMELLLHRTQKGPYEVFNIGRNDPIQTSELAKMIIQMTASESEIILTNPDPTIIPHKQADFGHIKRELGWEAHTPLAVGLEKVITRARRDL